MDVLKRLQEQDQEEQSSKADEGVSHRTHMMPAKRQPLEKSAMRVPRNKIMIATYAEPPAAQIAPDSAINIANSRQNSNLGDSWQIHSSSQDAEVF